MAHQYVLQVYEYTSRFPKAEIFGLTSQYLRAAASIAANIAEGFKKRGTKNKARFMKPRGHCKDAAITRFYQET